MFNDKSSIDQKATEDAFERSGRIFLGEEALSTSSRRLGERLAQGSRRNAKRSIARFLLPLVAAIVLFFAYIAWPRAAEVSLESGLEQALMEPMSLVALGETMNETENASQPKDQLRAFKEAYRQKQYDQALVHLSVFVEGGDKASSVGALDLYLADLHLKLGQYEKALSYLEESESNREVPLQADRAYCITYYKALAYLALGQKEEAAQSLQQSARQGGKLAEEANNLLRYLSVE